MAVTRIKNNQITDSTITAAKIASGTLTGGLFATDITFNSNVSIVGNLSLTGNTETVNATNTYIQDPIVTFNNGFNGSPSYDIGILVNRNLTATAPYGSVNAAWVWRESDKAFEGLMTTETGTTSGTINNSGFANVKIGNLTSYSEVVTNNLSAGSITATPISGSTGYFTTAQATNLSTGNAVISGGYISSLTNATITTTNITTGATTNFSTGNAQITGAQTYIGTGATLIANIYADTGYFTNFSSGNITGAFTGTVNGTVITANVSLYDSITATTTNGTFYPQVVDKTTGNVSTYSVSSFNINPSTGILSATQFSGAANFTTAVATNLSTGNAVISGGYISSLTNATITTTNITTGATTNF